ncbi:excalibur calcium-binding domain-containing protein [Corynebacterium kalinowskii]|uniref:excalibur calcium-binding domain-containing protein n=1 Tax=Corynebacterium kalinowskii TaxID=2675216 RepID=UPI001E6124D1|nr:excalibur calcium-binding domain-containing protein [Corynebacterium kalinowskii]
MKRYLCVTLSCLAAVTISACESTPEPKTVEITTTVETTKTVEVTKSPSSTPQSSSKPPSSSTQTSQQPPAAEPPAPAPAAAPVVEEKIEDYPAQPQQFFAPPPPAPAPAQAPAPAAASYGSCKEARAAGAAPLYKGSPGYSSKLDRDGDGVACE